MSLVRKPPHVQPGDADALDIVISPMKRRHLRGVMRIEEQVYPRPWTLGVFHSEIGQKDGSRCYIVAREGSTIVGYSGFLTAMEDAHITNVAVDPAWHRHKIGSRLLLTLAYQARLRGLQNLTLEVRVSNAPAQAMYRTFGFVPVGMRSKYYEGVEDAVVMWCHGIDEPEYATRLRSIEAALPGSTTWEGLAT